MATVMWLSVAFVKKTAWAIIINHESPESLGPASAPHPGTNASPRNGVHHTSHLVDGAVGQPEPKLAALANGLANDLGGASSAHLGLSINQWAYQAAVGLNQ